MLAGIVQSPARQSPFVNIDAPRAVATTCCSAWPTSSTSPHADADAARKKPIVVRGRLQPAGSVAPYFVEEVRKRLEQRYGAKALYESGLAVTTTLDVRMQQSANRAVDYGLRRIDKRRGFRRPLRNVVAEGQTIEAFKDERWLRPIAVGDIVPAVVESIGKPGPANGARVRIGRYHADLTREGIRVDAPDLGRRPLQAR